MPISMTTRDGFEWYYITMLLILPQYHRKENLIRFAYYWNTGIMEYWGLGNWDSGPLEKFVFDLGGSILNHENPPL